MSILVSFGDVKQIVITSTIITVHVNTTNAQKPGKDWCSDQTISSLIR
jgi:hypothetical protein